MYVFKTIALIIEIFAFYKKIVKMLTKISYLALRGYMHSLSIRKVSKGCCWIILSIYTVWLYITSDIKELPSLEKQLSPKIRYLDNATFAPVHLSHQALGNHFLDSANITSSRRSYGQKESYDVKIGAKDYHLQRQQRGPILLKILRLQGQDFGSDLNDPDFKDLHDFQKYKTPKYLRNFKNPCFYQNTTLGRGSTGRVISRLQCVPYFMIAGFPKCGTTDLWSRLKQHPDVVWQHVKEINFFNKHQYEYVSIERAVDFYHGMLSTSTAKIETCMSNKNANFHHCITGDASVDTIFDNKFWRQLPGNERQTEPALTNANYVYKINPNMKIIVLLRDPIERLYSDYLYMSTSVGYATSPEDFHNTVVDRIGNFTSCWRRRSLRACAYDMYDDWNVQTYKVRLIIGLYHIFLSDWMKVFPHDNFLILKSKDTRRPNILMKIFKFLGLTPQSRAHIEETYNSQKYQNERNKNSPLMLSKTRKLLQEFYEVFNQELETMFPHVHF